MSWVEEQYKKSGIENTVDHVVGTVTGVITTNPLSLVGQAYDKFKEEYDRLEDSVNSEYDRFEGRLSEVDYGSYITNPIYAVDSMSSVTTGTSIGEYSTKLTGSNKLEGLIGGLTGAKNEEMERINKMGTVIEDINNDYEDERARLFAFDEIFFMALKNEYRQTIGDKVEEYEIVVADYKELYGWIDDLQGTFLGKLAYTFISIVGGLSYDTKKALRGDWEAIKRIVMTIVTVIIIVVLYMKGFVYTATVMLIGLVHQLQVTYANSALTKMIFNVIDTASDALGLRKLGSDFEHFDSDSEYYEDTIATGNIAITIAVLVAAITAPTPAPGELTASEALTAEATAAGIPAAETLAATYGAMQTALMAGDLVSMYTHRNDLEEKLKAEQAAATKKQQELATRRMITQSRDLSYILEGYEANYQQYIYGLEDGSTVDPYDPSASIPMNTRFRATSEVQYGYEDTFTMFSETNFNHKILYGDV